MLVCACACDYVKTASVNVTSFLISYKGYIIKETATQNSNINTINEWNKLPTYCVNAGDVNMLIETIRRYLTDEVKT